MPFSLAACLSSSKVSVLSVTVSSYLNRGDESGPLLPQIHQDNLKGCAYPRTLQIPARAKLRDLFGFSFFCSSHNDYLELLRAEPLEHEPLVILWKIL